jgi:hypothetical protein
MDGGPEDNPKGLASGSSLADDVSTVTFSHSFNEASSSSTSTQSGNHLMPDALPAIKPSKCLFSHRINLHPPSA